MAHFDLINEFSSVYAPTIPASKRRRKSGRWILALAPLATVAVVIVAISAL